MPFAFPVDTFFPVWITPPPSEGESKKATAEDFMAVSHQNLTLSRRMEKLSLEQYYQKKNARSSSAFDDWKEAQHFQVPQTALPATCM